MSTNKFSDKMNKNRRVAQIDEVVDGMNESGQILNLSPSEIIPDPNQPRKEFSESELAELAKSIKERGQIQPVVVRREGDKFMLIVGERRWRAISTLKNVPVKAVMQTGERDEVQVLLTQLAENDARVGHNPIEHALAYQRVVEALGGKQVEASKALNVSKTRLSTYLGLLSASPEARDEVWAFFKKEGLQSADLMRLCCDIYEVNNDAWHDTVAQYQRGEVGNLRKHLSDMKRAMKGTAGEPAGAGEAAPANEQKSGKHTDAKNAGEPSTAALRVSGVSQEVNSDGSTRILFEIEGAGSVAPLDVPEEIKKKLIDELNG